MNRRKWHEEKIVSIDFDGVLSQYNGWKGENIVGKPMDGAKDFVEQLMNAGYTPVVFSTRKSDVIKKWLKEYGLPAIEVTNVKYPSLVYIDDRCVKFDGDFAKLETDLKEYDVYWRTKKGKIFDASKK